MARPYKKSYEYPELISFGKAVRSIRLDMGISQEFLEKSRLSCLDPKIYIKLILPFLG